jgi:hypothetical protein
VKPVVAVLERFADDNLDRSKLAEIQGKISKKGKRNPVSRFFHAKYDKETIATLKSDLSGILQTFNVRSVTSVWLLLTVRSQTALALNTNTIVTDIRHIMTKGHEWTDSNNRSVSTPICSSPNEHSPSSRLEPGQRSRLLMDSTSDISIQQTRRIPTTSAGGLLWTERVDREDHRFCRTPHFHRSHRRRWNRQDFHRPHHPPRRSHQATVR